MGGALCESLIDIPQFWADVPDLWFYRLEAQFSIAGITSDTIKYNYVIVSLDKKVAFEIKDIILQPPENGKYLKVKEELIKRMSFSEDRMNYLKQTIPIVELGDRRPSKFLNELRLLAVSLCDESKLRQIWISCLPKQARAILATQADLDLDTLSRLADKLIEFIGSVCAECGASASSTASNSATTPDELQKKAELVSKQICSLSSSSCSRSRSASRCRPQSQSQLTESCQQPELEPSKSCSQSRSSSKSSKKSRSPTPAPQDPKMCWYHRYYGKEAHNCVEPCEWKSIEN